MKKYSFEEIQATKPSVDEVKNRKRTPIYVILDNIRSLYNVGSIFRTSDAVLVEKIYLWGRPGCPPRNEISKTALGAEEIVPWEYYDNASDVILELKEKGVRIVATEIAKGAKEYSEYDFNFPIALVFGHEVHGISDEIMEMVDDSIYLPMLGRANSLNVATCYGITVYEAFKQYKNSIKEKND